MLTVEGLALRASFSLLSLAIIALRSLIDIVDPLLVDPAIVEYCLG